MQNSLQSSIECSSVKPPVKDGRALHAFDLEGNSIRVIHYMHQVLIYVKAVGVNQPLFNLKNNPYSIQHELLNLISCNASYDNGGDDTTTKEWGDDSRILIDDSLIEKVSTAVANVTLRLHNCNFLQFSFYDFLPR